MVGVPYPTRRKNEGKNLARKHPELSKKRRVFARKKRRGKRAETKSARKKHKAARKVSAGGAHVRYAQRSHSSDLNFLNGISHIDTR